MSNTEYKVTVNGVELQCVTGVKDVTYRRTICSSTGPLKGLDWEVTFLNGNTIDYSGENVQVSIY